MKSLGWLYMRVKVHSFKLFGWCLFALFVNGIDVSECMSQEINEKQIHQFVKLYSSFENDSYLELDAIYPSFHSKYIDSDIEEIVYVEKKKIEDVYCNPPKTADNLLQCESGNLHKLNVRYHTTFGTTEWVSVVLEFTYSWRNDKPIHWYRAINFSPRKGGFERMGWEWKEVSALFDDYKGVLPTLRESCRNYAQKHGCGPICVDEYGIEPSQGCIVDADLYCSDAKFVEKIEGVRTSDGIRLFFKHFGGVPELYEEPDPYEIGYSDPFVWDIPEADVQNFLAYPEKYELKKLTQTFGKQSKIELFYPRFGILEVDVNIENTMKSKFDEFSSLMVSPEYDCTGSSACIINNRFDIYQNMPDAIDFTMSFEVNLDAPRSNFETMRFHYDPRTGKKLEPDDLIINHSRALQILENAFIEQNCIIPNVIYKDEALTDYPTFTYDEDNNSMRNEDCIQKAKGNLDFAPMMRQYAGLYAYFDSSYFLDENEEISEQTFLNGSVYIPWEQFRGAMMRIPEIDSVHADD